MLIHAIAAVALIVAAAPLAAAQTFGPSSVRQRAPVITIERPERAAEPAPPQPTGRGDVCADAYYSALEPLRTGRGAVLANLLRAMRATDSDLPGKWQVPAPPIGKPKPPPKPERVCVETKELPGKAPRCVRYETRQSVVPPDVVARIAPSADEARILRALEDFVQARGALPDVSVNGRQTYLVQRIAQDVHSYATQPRHPNICAGSREVLEFYGSQLTPIKRRLDDLQAVAKQAVPLAAQRVRAIAVTEMRLYDKAVADAAKVEEQRAKLVEIHKAAVTKYAEAAAVLPAGTPPPALLAEPVLPPVPPLPMKPNGPAKLEDYAVVGLPSLVAEALRPMLPQTIITEIVDEKIQVKMFTRARTALLDPQVAVANVLAEVREVSLMALRLLEARVYADLYASRYKELDGALGSAMTDLRAAQSSSCTCRE